MSENFSYSKLETYDQCSFKYKLKYVDGHYIYSANIATEFGTAIHEAEETIANSIKDGKPIDYIAIKNKLIMKLAELEHKYPEAYREELDKAFKTYKDKAYDYLEHGIYRLENFLKANPQIKVVGAEIPIKFEYKDKYVFKGFIDRLLLDTNTNKYILQDIKTWGVPKEQKELTTPLQFVIYSMALKDLYKCTTDDIKCQYDLPVCDLVQDAGTSGFIGRGMKKLDSLFDKIEKQEFEPKPSPLCHWCEFCATNPNQPEDGKNLCPYHSLWTKDRKTFEKASEWKGLAEHGIVLEAYINKNKKTV